MFWETMASSYLIKLYSRLNRFNKSLTFKRHQKAEKAWVKGFA